MIAIYDSRPRGYIRCGPPVCSRQAHLRRAGTSKAARRLRTVPRTSSIDLSQEFLRHCPKCGMHRRGQPVRHLVIPPLVAEEDHRSAHASPDKYESALSQSPDLLPGRLDRRNSVIIGSGCGGPSALRRAVTHRAFFHNNVGGRWRSRTPRIIRSCTIPVGKLRRRRNPRPQIMA